MSGKGKAMSKEYIIVLTAAEAEATVAGLETIALQHRGHERHGSVVKDWLEVVRKIKREVRELSGTGEDRR
jgi:hypothetical protein